MHRGIGQDAAQTTANTASTTSADEHPDGPSTAAIQPIGVVQIFPRPLDTPPRAWVINTSLKIGRRAQSAIQLENDRVSRDHASLELGGSGLRVLDLQSRHGTFVDGVRATPEVMAKPGSIVRCGDSLLLVVRDAPAYSTTHRLSGDFLGIPHDVWGGPSLFRIWQQAAYAAELSDPVLLLGESGSGKEVVARLIHATRNPRGPFVAISLGAIHPNLFEVELFGHTHGAFTGAARSPIGAFRESASGVLFLDEVGDLAQDLQLKLLRAIEEKRVRPVGGAADFPFDARIISATSRHLRDASNFRSDLRYRLSGIVIQVPPLRERRDEVLLLALATLKEKAPGVELSVEAAETLALADWPGNVRELHSALVQATMELRQSGGRLLQREHFAMLTAVNAGDAITTLTPDTVRTAMARAQGNASHAAKILGVSRATLYNFCGRHGLELAAVRAQVISDLGSRISDHDRGDAYAH